ncbi:MAG: LLM class flavin-dependent oxidoreductase [Candidatus Binatus sp.]|nr:LLM class flavin-dependent oxidoreductase [Candidatus Binatus sp.]MDO8431199.1 LLM class flavin-dependent oxidoreductase [Candidatus Binatus sp.]
MTGKRRYWGLLFPSDAATMSQVAQGCEAAGLEGIWAVQLYGPPFLSLAAAAMVTKRLKLGSGVALAFTRSPLETALSAIDVDTMSGGRMVLGLGTSIRWWNESWHGVAYGKPIAHLREVVRMVREIIAGAHGGKLGKIAGEYHQLDLRGFSTMAPPVRNRIPIYLPAVFESAVRLAGEIADGLPGHPIWSARWIENEVQENLEASLKQAGRQRSEFDLNVWAFVTIDEDRKPGDQRRAGDGRILFLDGAIREILRGARLWRRGSSGMRRRTGRRSGCDVRLDSRRDGHDVRGSRHAGRGSRASRKAVGKRELDDARAASCRPRRREYRAPPDRNREDVLYRLTLRKCVRAPTCNPYDERE